MNKLLKRSITFAVAFILMLTAGVVVKADGRWYDSTIYISHNSTLIGKERTYDYDYYRLDITPSTLLEGDLSPGQVRLYVELIRPLYRLGIKYGTQTKYSGTTTFNVSSVGTLKKIYAGNCGDGKRYFGFSTYGHDGAGYGSLSGEADIYNYT
ncbi:MAG: hypothetical protein IJN90_04730 [Bacilli bacterium]|nr:hypothetical protein [Bacilli bacterium]